MTDFEDAKIYLVERQLVTHSGRSVVLLGKSRVPSSTSKIPKV